MILPVSLAVVISSLLLGVNADAAEVSEFNPLSCVGNSSLPCLSHKIISAFRRIRKIPEIPITEWMSLVPSADEENSTLLEEKPIVESRFRRQGLLWTIGEAVDDFLFSRSVRIALPNWATGSDHAVDLDVSRAFTQVTGRGKKHGGGGGGKKGGKMGMMVCMLMGKMMMLTMGMVKMKAMKAMMVAGMAMMLSVGQMMKSMMGGKGGGESESKTKHVIVIQEHGGGGGGGGSAPSSSYGVPSSGGGGGGWSGGGGGGSSGGGGWSGGGGGGGGGGWQGGGGGGGDTGGGYNYDQPASGGWGKRAYHYDTYITHPPSSNPNTTKP